MAKTISKGRGDAIEKITFWGKNAPFPATLSAARSPGQAYNPSIDSLPEVHGVALDPHTRCAHWHSPLDVVAIPMRCCGRLYACRECHDALEDHPVEVWPREAWDARAILCGVCRTTLTIAEYVAGPSRCPACGAGFNPGCKAHHDLYFEAV